MRVSRSLSASLFQKGNLSVFIGLIVGLLSIPILLTAVYEPQKLISLAMVAEDNYAGGSGSFFTKPTTAQEPKITSPSKQEVKEQDKGLPDDECYVDKDCGVGYVCRRSGGAKRCVAKKPATMQSGGGGKPYAIPALPEGRPMPTPTRNPISEKINEIMYFAIRKCTKILKRTNIPYVDWQCVAEYVIKRAPEIPIPEITISP